MRQNKIWTVTLLTLLLSALSLAAPRVALVKINKGSAQLDGKAFKVAQMANEGQVLTVDAGSEVRIQLLGSSSEMTVSGPKKVNIQKAALASQAEKVTRGGLAVTLDIGNRNTAGALVTRGSSKSLHRCPHSAPLWTARCTRTRAAPGCVAPPGERDHPPDRRGRRTPERFRDD